MDEIVRRDRAETIGAINMPKLLAYILEAGFDIRDAKRWIR
jgi:hypothetical protein